MPICECMSLGFIFAAGAFALVVGCAVAGVDRGGEARVAAPWLRTAEPVDGESKPARPATERRAA